MLLIPIGAEDEIDRHKPVVTLALIAINVLWFAALYLLPGGSSWKSDAEAARTDLEQYWEQHPGLTPPESLVRLLGPEAASEIAEEARSGASLRNPSMAWLDDLQRQELDRRALRLEAALAERPARKYGFVPAAPTVKGLVGSLFTHGGFIHLAGNMLFLWATGPFVEAIVGGGAFLALYLSSGIASVLAHWLASVPSTEPLVGASGAIAGVMGALLVRQAGARIRFLWLPVLFLPQLRLVFRIPAFVVLPFWFLEQVSSAKLDPDAPVAWWAHIGGFVFGMASGALVGRVRGPKRAVAARPRHPQRAARPAIGPRPLPARLRVAVVSTGHEGTLLVTNQAAPLMKRAFGAAEAGGLALDETIDMPAGPVDLRVDLRVGEGSPRSGSVPALLRGGETRILRVEPRPSGLQLELR